MSLKIVKVTFAFKIVFELLQHFISFQIHTHTQKKKLKLREQIYSKGDNSFQTFTIFFLVENLITCLQVLNFSICRQLYSAVKATVKVAINNSHLCFQSISEFNAVNTREYCKQDHNERFKNFTQLSFYTNLCIQSLMMNYFDVQFGQ